jgi:flotillin
MGVEVELKKVGLRLINVNVQDITDASGYIDALGQEAASKAIAEAKVKVAMADRDGEIGAAAMQRDKRISVASANAEATRGENASLVDIANSDAMRRSAAAEAERMATAAEKVAEAKVLEEAYVSEQAAEKQRAERETRPLSSPISSCPRRLPRRGNSSKQMRKPRKHAASSKVSPMLCAPRNRRRRMVSFS